MKGFWKKLTVSALSLLCGASMLAGCASQASHVSVPETDLAADYQGEVKDGNGNLLVPFDVAYPTLLNRGSTPTTKTRCFSKWTRARASAAS